MTELSNTCNVIDDEEHRLNYCARFREMNFHDSNVDDKVEFRTIFSDDHNTLKVIIDRIGKVWNMKNGHGTMNMI